MLISVLTTSSKSDSPDRPSSAAPPDIWLVDRPGLEEGEEVDSQVVAGSQWNQREKKDKKNHSLLPGSNLNGLSTEQVPVSAYVGSSKNLKDLKEEPEDFPERQSRRQRVVGLPREDLERRDRSPGEQLCGRVTRVARWRGYLLDVPRRFRDGSVLKRSRVGGRCAR
jgi:hypothetical protein